MYSPKIDEKLVRKLYKLKQQTKVPMTKMVNEAVITYLMKNEIGEKHELEHNQSHLGRYSSSIPGFC
ncbi:MAG: ribbon-helix-helix domain-containing protein [Ignavibacteria bacterium]|nr:ribbon-helix-helix domain-containing protein [Ignavibacteria bacterium]